MATAEAILELRRKIGDVTEPFEYEGGVLSVLIDSYDASTDKAASSIWTERAATYATMVDISEAGSSRKNSDLFKNAQAMATRYGGSDVPGEEEGPGVSWTTTRRIVRP